jgi:hypothetical protein
MAIPISSMPGDSLRVSSTCLTTLLGFRYFLKRTLKQVFSLAMILDTQPLKLCCWSNMSSIPKADVWTPRFTQRLQVLNFYILAARFKFFNLCTKNGSQRHSFLYSFVVPESCCTIHLNTKQTTLVSPYMGTQSELILFHRICGHRLNGIHKTWYSTKWMILMVLDMAQGVSWIQMIIRL